jgi:rhomboid protease GluP
VSFIIVLVVFAAVAYRVASAAERERGLEYARDCIATLKMVAARRRDALTDFRTALRARMPHVIVAPAIALVSVAVGIALLFGPAAMTEPNALLAWGASVGPRTTNGEWWRLVSASFVHAGAFQLLVSVVVVVRVGSLVERLAGRFATAAVYLSAGVMTGLANLSSRPLEVTVSAAGAACGFYGLFAAIVAAQHVRQVIGRLRGRHDNEAPGKPSELTIPLLETKALGVGAALFLLYTAIAGASGLWGFAVGLLFGMMLAPLRIDPQASTRRVAIAATAVAIIAVAYGLPLRNIIDVKPEIARVIASEEHTAKAFQAALDALKKGRASADAVARVADGANVAELQAADRRLASLAHVPAEQQHLVDDAREYLRLRCEAWRLRADALRRMTGSARRASDDQSTGQLRLQAEARFRSNMMAMGRAESAERASMAAFDRVRAAPQPQAQ